MRTRILETCEIRMFWMRHICWRCWGIKYRKIKFSYGGFLKAEENADAVVEEMLKISFLPNMTAPDFGAWVDFDESLKTLTALTDYNLSDSVSKYDRIDVCF